MVARATDRAVATAGDGGAAGPISELDDTLHLLFTEADQQRGSRLLTNRLFEVALVQILRWVVDHPRCSRSATG
jgi:hypothetical protein